MAYCSKCGSRIDDNAKFCPACGSAYTPANEDDNRFDINDKLQALNETADTTTEYDKSDIENNKVMAVLAYLGILVLIPIFAAKNSKYARYHANQGLILLIVCVIWSIIYGVLTSVILSISWRLYSLVSIIGLVSWVFVILAIIGIVNAVSGKAKELPVIGKYKILK